MIISVEHNFETAHRLPFLGGKCTNLHGHSWRVKWYFEGHLSSDGIVTEYGQLKKELREWVDQNLDHGAMLGREDPLSTILDSLNSKVYTFGVNRYTTRERAGDRELRWPTVENVAVLLMRAASAILARQGMRPMYPGIKVIQVDVQETAVNSATWQEGDVVK
jgi:6-pyruvoyltetrahydropterin/6-carboxytetrahydropterin synthase